MTIVNNLNPSASLPSAWVGSLSAGDTNNWDVCKEYLLWGSGSNMAGGVRTGDDLFIWQSQSGWLAWCKVTSDARIPGPTTPWEDDRTYKYIFSIRVVVELAEPFNPGSSDNRQRITDIPNIKLGQFPKITRVQAELISSFFGLVNPPRGRIEEGIEAEADAAEAELLTRKDLGPTEVERLVKARRGQGRFRENVKQIETFCRVTGLANFDYLRASHIKPWARSDDTEKLDGNNGLMLAPHVDMLFDGGWIQFSDEGFMITSPHLDADIVPLWHLEQVGAPKPFNTRQIEYLEYHRSAIFQS